MRSLRTKLVMIMVILILALMCVIGAFLINGVGNFYISQFYEQMEKTFSPEFIGQLQEIPAQEQNAPERMKELLMAQAGLGIDIATRNVYILDETGNVLASSNQQTSVSMTANLLTAMNGEVGQESSITSSFMDLAVPIASADSTYIVYILDSRATVDALTGELFSIILSALGLGLVICVVLSFLLAQILITPIRALTLGTRQVAAGDFSQRIEVEGQDEIGVLTRNFNHMAKVLHDAVHAVGFIDDDAHEVIVKLARQLVSGGDDGFGVGFDVGKRRPQLVRHVRNELAPRLLAFSLLGHIVDDDQRAALRLIGGKRRHEKLQLPVACRLLRL